MDSFIYIKYPQNKQLPKYTIINSKSAFDALVYITVNNKLDSGHDNILSLVRKYYELILDYVTDDIFVKLENQNGLEYWDSDWWNQNTEPSLSLQQILQLGIDHEVITYKILYKHITKKTNDWTYVFTRGDIIIL